MLDVPGALAEDLCDLLLAEGATSAVVEEFLPEGAVEQKIFAHSGQNYQSGSDTGGGSSSQKSIHPRVWDRCKVIGYFPAEYSRDAAATIVSESMTALGIDHPSPGSTGSTAFSAPVSEEVRMQDWESAIKDSYQPVEVASGLWIVPTWAQPRDQSASATNLVLEPGMAFGTGDHPTTRLCLRWLRALQLSSTKVLQGARVMDYGTGSGVLATAALVMGAAHAVGTDVEPLAIKAAMQNADINDVGGAFLALQCDSDVSQPGPLETAGVDPKDSLFDV